MKSKFFRKICSIALASLLFCGAGVSAGMMMNSGNLKVCAAVMETYDPVFSYRKNTDGGITIYEIENVTDEIIVPETIDGYTVTEIGDRVFAQYGKKLKSVVLPDTVTSIGFRAFYGCEVLENIRLPKNLKTIGEAAFYSCRALKSIELPDGLISIEKTAFCGCSSLEDIRFPDSLRHIGKEALFGTAWFYKQQGDAYAGKVYYCHFGVITEDTVINIKKGTKAIADYAFLDKTNLMNVTLPDMLEYIGEASFRGCKYLPEIVIPDSVKYIGASAFQYCENMCDIAFPDELDFIGRSAFDRTAWIKTQTDNIYIGNIFYCLKRMTNHRVIIREGTRGIAEYAFYNNRYLEGVEIPGSVRYIGRSAFEKCTVLNSVTMQDGTKTIEASAFKDCGSLETISIPDSIEEIQDSAFYGCKKLTEAHIPDHLRVISTNVFCNCESLKSIEIPDRVEMIGYAAFSGCGAVSGSLYIPDSVTVIDGHAFYKCNSITDLRLSQNITALSPDVFSCCTKLQSVTIPDGVRMIGECAFSCCEGLTEVNIPYGVASIGKNAFMSCINLPEVIIPGSVTKIESGAFSCCLNMTDITIPDSVTEIGEGLLSGGYPSKEKTIKGKSGSMAEAYAKENNISFEAIEFPLVNRSKLHTEKLLLGESVTVNCMAEGGERDYKYAVFYRKAGTTKWTTVQGFKADPVVYVTPKAACEYEIRVSVRDANGNINRRDMKLSVRKPLVNKSQLDNDRIALGEKVRVRCFASGGEGEYQYAVYYKKTLSDKWTRVRGYGTSNIVMLMPKAAVNYDVRVDVRDKSGAVVSKELKLYVSGLASYMLLYIT